MPPNRTRVVHTSAHACTGSQGCAICVWRCYVCRLCGLWDGVELRSNSREGGWRHGRLWPNGPLIEEVLGCVVGGGTVGVMGRSGARGEREGARYGEGRGGGERNIH